MARLIKVREPSGARKLATSIFEERLPRDFEDPRGTIGTLPIYSIAPANLDQLTEAVRTGWRYMWIDEKQTAGASIDIVRSRSRGFRPTSYSTGSFPLMLNRRLKSLVESLAGADQLFRPRILISRPLQLEAIWLRAKGGAIHHVSSIEGEFDDGDFFREAKRRAGELSIERRKAALEDARIGKAARQRSKDRDRVR